MPLKFLLGVAYTTPKYKQLLFPGSRAGNWGFWLTIHTLWLHSFQKGGDHNKPMGRVNFIYTHAAYLFSLAKFLHKAAQLRLCQHPSICCCHFFYPLLNKKGVASHHLTRSLLQGLEKHFPCISSDCSPWKLLHSLITDRKCARCCRQLEKNLIWFYSWRFVHIHMDN